MPAIFLGSRVDHLAILGDVGLHLGQCAAQGLLNGLVDRANEIRDRVNGLKVLIEGQIAASALLAHLEENMGLADAPLRRENKPLALENVPVPTDFVVSTDDVLGVETSAGVDLHRKHLPPTIIRQ